MHAVGFSRDIILTNLLYYFYIILISHILVIYKQHGRFIKKFDWGVKILHVELFLSAKIVLLYRYSLLIQTRYTSFSPLRPLVLKLSKRQHTQTWQVLFASLSTYYNYFCWILYGLCGYMAFESVYLQEMLPTGKSNFTVWKVGDNCWLFLCKRKHVDY